MANWTEEDFARLQQKRKAKPKRSAPAPAEKTGTATKLQALGRLKTGEQNKTEAAFDQYLSVLLHTGEIAWYKFEGIKLMLAKNTSITVDFAVMEASGALVMYDVKGAKAIVTDDAHAKMKIAAEMYPWPFRYAFPKKKADGGGWTIEEIRA